MALLRISRRPLWAGRDAKGRSGQSGRRPARGLGSAAIWMVSVALHGTVGLSTALLTMKVQARHQEETVLTVALTSKEQPRIRYEMTRRSIFSSESPVYDPEKEPAPVEGEVVRFLDEDRTEEIRDLAMPAPPAKSPDPDPMDAPPGMLVQMAHRPASMGLGASGGSAGRSAASGLLRARSSAASRLEAARAGGGGDDTENAVEHALSWLARHQDPDGKWSCDGFSRNCGKSEPPPWVIAEAPREAAEPRPDATDAAPPAAAHGALAMLKLPGGLGQGESGRQAAPDRRAVLGGTGECPSAGKAEHTNGVTGLALLAFLGSGYTHLDGKYRDTVKAGLEYMIRQQKADGQLGDSAGYDLIIPSLALCEAYALSRDEALRGPAQRAVDFLLSIQSPGRAWRYGAVPGFNNGSDVTLAAWGAQALKAARIGGLRVDDRGMQGVRSFLDSCSYRWDGHWLCGYTSANGGTVARSACGLVACLDSGEPQGSPRAMGLAKHLRTALPRWPASSDDSLRPDQNQYYWYYGSIAMFRLGKPYWPEWNEAMKKALLENQVQGGCADGSWQDPSSLHNTNGGRVYATAIGALTLEVYYRYLRIYE